MQFLNKTIIVTGGTKGIGKAIADEFYRYGANIIITCREDLKSGCLVETNNNYKVLRLDLDKKKSVTKFNQFLNSLDRIDIFVNNAGINKIDRIENISMEDFDEVIDVNLKNPFLLCQTVAKKMISEGNPGRIVNIASIWSKITKEGRTSYITSKAGLAGLTRGLATDLAKHQILVNTVSPGFVLTDLTRKSLSQSEMLLLEKMIPIGRMALPGEIAKLVVFLASDDNTYISGQNIVIDGGFSNV